MAGTAAGELLPPYVIYKANNIYDTWTTGGPKGTRYNRTASENSTHLTQPIDIAFFRPMKMAWRNILLKWKKTDGRTQASVPKGCFPRLLKVLINELSDNVETNLKAGFRKAGIIPVDRDQVLSRLPSSENEDPNKSRYAVDKSVLQLLKEMRYGTMNIKNNKKKVRVIPGKLVNIDPESKDLENKIVNTPTQKKEVQKLIDKLNYDFMNKDSTESKSKKKINDSQQQQDEEFIINYIDESASIIDYLPDIETNNIFSEFKDPAQGEMCDTHNTKVVDLEKKENKTIKQKNVEIIFIEKIKNTRSGVNLKKCKKIPLNTVKNIKKEKTRQQLPSNTKNRHYYKSDAEILKALDDDSI
ncbi:unnamed protein product [Pieris macdunnoughi]|uniref:Uncharacterized protein n=1 Tax=Pieris macdunnoughi TaxID=345717 RepID=A0A821Y870_9NEOP|nr:unnamed protein product [Pieris macdunnoughi]